MADAAALLFRDVCWAVLDLGLYSEQGNQTMIHGGSSSLAWNPISFSLEAASCAIENKADGAPRHVLSRPWCSVAKTFRHGSIVAVGFHSGVRIGAVVVVSGIGLRVNPNFLLTPLPNDFDRFIFTTIRQTPIEDSYPAIHTSIIDHERRIENTRR
jgi:hypothetical protein